MRIAFRVDASTAIGLGHLRRCLSLAHALREHGAVVHFVSRRSDVGVAEAVGGSNFACVLLPEVAGSTGVDDVVPHASWVPAGWAADAAQTQDAVRAEAPDWVVVDHYALDARWHAAVRAGLGCRIAAIDDLADRTMAVDLLFDHNHCEDHRAKYSGWLDQASGLLGGPRYALLAPAYAGAPRYEFRPEVRSVGIFMGGIDTGGHSTLALRACRVAGYRGPIELVTTRGNPHFAQIQQAVSDDENATLVADLPDLAAFFARHDLQIGAGGGATWERCCIGSPTLALVCASNQLAVVPSLARLGVVSAPDPVTSRGLSDVATAVGRLLRDTDGRREMAMRSRELVDGRGARRVAVRILSDGLAVRPASLDDASLLHLWRNHPSTREASLDPGEIAWPDHLSWVQRTLDDPRRALLVGCIGGVPVGVIRFDRDTSDHFEVSLYVDPSLHGVSLGGALLRAGEDCMLDADADAAPRGFVASVLESNRASQRLFERAGYQRSAPRRWHKAVAAAARSQR